MEWISAKLKIYIPINAKILLGWKNGSDEQVDFGIWTGEYFRGMDTAQPYTEPDYWAIIDELPPPNIKYRVVSHEGSRDRYYFQEFPIGVNREEILKAMAIGQSKYGQSWIEKFNGVSWRTTYEILMDRE